MTSQELNDYIQSFNSSKAVTAINGEIEKYIGIVDVRPSVAHEPDNIQVEVLDEYDGDTKVLIYSASSYEYESVTIPAGWSVLTVANDETLSIEAVTEKTTFNFGKSVTVTSVDADFAPINGLVLGVVAGEAPVYYDITANITDGTYDGPETVEKYEEAYFSIEPAAGHDFPASVSVTGATLVEYDEAKGDGMINSPTGAVTITATCPAETPGDQ